MMPNKMQEEEKKMEVQKKPKSRSWFKTFEEFCNRTDLHGYKYIVMPGLTFYERYVEGVGKLVGILRENLRVQHI